MTRVALARRIRDLRADARGRDGRIRQLERELADVLRQQARDLQRRRGRVEVGVVRSLAEAMFDCRLRRN